MTNSECLYRGTGGSDKKVYETTMELNREVDVENSKHWIRGRGCELVLAKTEEDQSKEYWPRLLKGPSKAHWLKVDFNKWQDEDEGDDEEALGGMPGMGAGGDFEEMMRQMGGLGGMGGMPGMGGLDDLETPEDESDDEALPDLEETATAPKDQPASPAGTTTA